MIIFWKQWLRVSLGLCLIFWSSVPQVEARQKQRILTLPFYNSSEDTSLENMKQNIPDLLEVFFSQSSEFIVVNRTKLDDLLAEQKLALSWPMPQEKRQKVGKLLRATIIITGGYIKDETGLIINTHVFEVATGQLLVSNKIRGEERKIAEVVHQIYLKLVQGLHEELPELGENPVDGSPLANLHFMQGLSFYYSAQYNQAIGEFIQSADEKNLKNISRLWMANSYLAQEEYAHAYVELKKLEVRQTADMKQDEIEEKINLCRDHLADEEIKIYEQIVSSY